MSQKEEKLCIQVNCDRHAQLLHRWKRTKCGYQSFASGSQVCLNSMLALPDLDTQIEVVWKILWLWYWMVWFVVCGLLTIIFVSLFDKDWTHYSSFLKKIVFCLFHAGYSKSHTMHNSYDKYWILTYDVREKYNLLRTSESMLNK